MFSRHNGMHFFDISTSKNAPKLVCFVHFDLEMCFAPQRRAFFRHLNFQKCSEPGVFCTFWLENVLRATTACIFWTSWCVLYILTWKCASRHKGMHLFDISTSKSAPNLVCFAHFDLEMCFAPHEPTFRPSGTTNHWKPQWIATFLPFRATSFFWLFLFSDLLFSSLLTLLWLFPPLLFHLSMLSEVWLLNFLRWFYIFHVLSCHDCVLFCFYLIDLFF